MTTTAIAASARERRRAARAAPPPLDTTRAGVIGALVLAVFTAMCVWMYARSGWTVWLVIAAPATSLLLVIAAARLYDLALLTLVALMLARRGVRCLVVHSQSPLWKDHIATSWLPRIGAAAVTLDWTERSRWKRNVKVEVFSRFCGSQRFVPCVIVFRRWRRPYVFRFARAFREARHGRTSYLQSLEKQLFATLER